MTSTSFNVGLGEEPRLSSRVLRPPGGGHTDIFGGDPEPPRGRRLNVAAASATSLGEPRQWPSGNVIAQNGQAAPAPAPAPAPTPEVEAPAPAMPPPPPTAEPAKPEPAQPAQPAAAAAAPAPEPPKRVRVPPGGFSSGLW